MTKAERLYPFHCGSQYLDWRLRNCDYCKKMDNENYTSECEIENAISLAACDDGSISKGIAKKMDMPEDCRVYLWECPEKEESQVIEFK